MSSSVTVVIVSYNQGHFLRQAVESVLHQTKHVDKTIIINNGSTDTTDAIAREYLELYFPYIEYYSYHHNRGQIAAYNRGLDLSKTAFTTFLDADDELDHTYTAKMLHQFSLDPSAAIIYSNTLLFGPRERSSWLTYPEEWRKKEGSSYTLHYPAYSETIKYLLKKHNYINNAALFKTQLARDVGGFVEHDFFDVHHFLWYRLLDAGHLAVHCPHILYRYRQYSIEQEHCKWMVRKTEAPNIIDQNILYFQEEIERLKGSPFYKTEQVLARLADNFKCDCER
ncbi:MAG: glycosyltransferase family A protein [Candidatus Roizmanbacteria bacterium]|nr:glycosyltransferase family A protein [Candidatus Roizmanbacteria bacterium]